MSTLCEGKSLMMKILAASYMDECVYCPCCATGGDTQDAEVEGACMTIAFDLRLELPRLLRGVAAFVLPFEFSCRDTKFHILQSRNGMHGRNAFAQWTNGACSAHRAQAHLLLAACCAILCGWWCLARMGADEIHNFTSRSARGGHAAPGTYRAIEPAFGPVAHSGTRQVDETCWRTVARLLRVPMRCLNAQ
jgi:hypothetical protein